MHRKHLYQREYRNRAGERITLYYARFTCKLKKKRRLSPLASDLPAARNKLKKLEARISTAMTLIWIGSGPLQKAAGWKIRAVHLHGMGGALPAF